MSAASAIAGLARGTAAAAATAVAAFGLLVVFHPFTPPAPAAPAQIAVPASELPQRIEAQRAALRQTETALDGLSPEALTATPAVVADDTRTQYEAQIAAATERRDLALRHAQAIRGGLKSGAPVSAMAEIRDSVVIGQLLAQQTTLEAQIAEQGARLKPTHPVMRALLAQRGALATQIREEAASIATALESEAKLDDTQIDLLKSNLPPAPAAASAPAATDTTGLRARAETQRAELDRLLDAYMNAPAASPTIAQPQRAANPLSLANLVVVAIAAIAAALFQILLAVRRRRIRRTADLAEWRRDADPELPFDLPEQQAPLRRAS